MKTTSIAIITLALMAGLITSCQRREADPSQVKASEQEADPSPVTASEQEAAPSSVKASESVTVGDFSITVPTDWKKFAAQEAATFERQYQQQSREIYQHFAGSDDPTKSVQVAAYHMPGENGSFVIVVMSLPPQANLMPMLKEQTEPKMQYGIQQGIIKRYLGMVSVDRAPLTGFYTKAIGRSGNVEVSGGLEHSKKKNTIVQLTLLAPDGWKEDAAVGALDKVLASVKLKGE